MQQRWMGFVMLAVSVGVTALAAQQAQPPVPTTAPKGWRDWQHIKTGVIYSDKHPLFGAFGGVHHIYANPTAAKAYKAAAESKGKKKFPDGSAIIFVLYEAKDDNGMFIAGNKKVVALMAKDSKRYGQTGGWGWQAWDANGKPIVTDPVAACFNCHKPMQDNDYVFSDWVP